MKKKEIEEITKVFSEIREQTHKRIVGMDDEINKLLITIFAGENSHLHAEGVPGVGKTELLKAIAQALDIKFGRIQFRNDLKPKDMLGYLNLDGEFVRGPLFFTNLLLADEINRASPKAQSAMLQAMAEGEITTEEIGTQKLDQPFIVVATTNPIEKGGGTNQLPEAQLDRFLLKELFNYPSTEDAIKITKLNVKSEFEPITPVIDGDEILAIRKVIEETVYVSDRIYHIAVRMTELTRPQEFDLAHEFKIKIGSSPRGHINLIKSSRVQAVMNGRDFVTPKDLLDIAFPVFLTRVFFKGQRDRDQGPAILKNLINEIVKEVFEESLPYE